jgi:hypothetical protein
MNEHLKSYLMDILESEHDSIVTINGGAAVEMVDRAIKKALANIADINTTEGTREVNLKIKIKPLDDHRSVIVYGIEVPPPKLCGQEPVACAADMKIDANGKGFYSKQRSTGQQTLPFSNVTPITGRE